MNAPTELGRLIPNLAGKVPADEWQTRVDLAAAYRLVALFKWDDLVFTHITARIPGTEHYLINPYGLMFEEITASSLVKIDLQGNVLQETPFPINPAGFTIHSAVHGARHDMQCVMHTGQWHRTLLPKIAQTSQPGATGQRGYCPADLVCLLRRCGHGSS